MTKVGFLDQLKPGEMIIVPGHGREPLRLSSAAMLERFADRSDAAPDASELLGALIASRTRRDKK